MNMPAKVWDTIQWNGVIDKPRDVVFAFLFVYGAGILVILAVSPAIALYALASHFGMNTTASVFVGVGGYVLALLHIRFGGVNINVRN